MVKYRKPYVDKIKLMQTHQKEVKFFTDDWVRITFLTRFKARLELYQYQLYSPSAPFHTISEANYQEKKNT